ncbi:hypothetical protein, partial [Enterobacter hormaechei]|uniref:hypothetical protein n=2 Tax=Enterobacteriaceae TaxID=543 RepID=UPI0012604F0B
MLKAIRDSISGRGSICNLDMSHITNTLERREREKQLQESIIAALDSLVKSFCKNSGIERSEGGDAFGSEENINVWTDVNKECNYNFNFIYKTINGHSNHFVTSIKCKCECGFIYASIANGEWNK